MDINSILPIVMIQPYTHCCLQRWRNYSPYLDPLHLIHGTRGLVLGWNYSLNILIFPSFVLVSCSLTWPPSLSPHLIQDTIKREIVWVDVLVVVLEYLYIICVCICMYVYIYIYIYIYIHIHTHMCIYTYVYKYTHTHTYIYIYTVYTYTHTYN